MSSQSKPKKSAAKAPAKPKAPAKKVSVEKAPKKFTSPNPVIGARQYASLRGKSAELLEGLFGRQKRATVAEWDRLWADVMSRKA